MARTLIASDGFNRANGQIGANWDVVTSPNTTGANVYNNQLSPSGLGLSNIGVARWVGAGTFQTDQYAKITLSALPYQDGNYRMGVVVRCSGDSGSASDYYFAHVYADSAPGSTKTHAVGKVVNGTRTLLRSVKDTVWVAGDTIALEVEGTALRLYRNDVLIDTLADSDLADGLPGIISSGSANVLLGDDWEAGNLGSGAIPAPPVVTATTNITQTSATVNWTHDGADVTSFEIQRETPTGAANWSAVSGSPTSAAARSINRTSLAPSTSYRHRVRAVGSGGSSAWVVGTGFVTLGTLTRKLKIKVSAAAQSATGVNGAVYSAPAGDDLTGNTKYLPEFKNKTFEAALEGNDAVLKVLASDAGVSGLAPGTTVAVILRSATAGAGSNVVPGTIIEE